MIEPTHVVGSFIMITVCDKPFKTYDEQIKILKSRGLIIDDEQNVKSFLEKESYYCVINGYKESFIIAGTDNFIKDTRFEYIQKLYCFDKSFRISLLPVLLGIENTLKSIIAYEFAKLYGECSYNDKNNFNISTKLLESKVINFIEHIQAKISECEKSQNQCYDNIRHYKKNHSAIPIWVLFTHLNMSDLSKFYDNLTPDARQDVCDHIVKIFKKPFNTSTLYNFLRILSDVRNLCAHNQRLYNYKCMHHLSKRHKFISCLLQKHGIDLNYDNILSIIISVYHLTTEEEFLIFFTHFKQDFEELLDLPSAFAVTINTKQNYSLYTFMDIIQNMVKGNG